MRGAWANTPAPADAPSSVRPDRGRGRNQTLQSSPVTLKDGRIVFEPAGEGVVVSFDKDGFAATVPGQFVDHWKKLR